MSSLIEEESKDVNMEHHPSSNQLDEFIFLQSLSLHSAPVRCLCVLNQNDALVSGSLDKTTKIYNLNANGKYDFDKEHSGFHDSFIYAVHKNVDNQGFYSASKDQKILHIDNEGNPVLAFEGHTGAVNSLSQAIPE